MWFICRLFRTTIRARDGQTPRSNFFAYKFNSIWKWKIKNHLQAKSHTKTEFNATRTKEKRIDEQQQKRKKSLHWKWFRNHNVWHTPSVSQTGGKAVRSNGSTHYGKLNATSSRSCSHLYRAERLANTVSTGWGESEKATIFVFACKNRLCRVRLTIETCRICFLLFCRSHGTSVCLCVWPTLFGRIITSWVFKWNHFNCMREAPAFVLRAECFITMNCCIINNLNLYYELRNTSWVRRGAH